MRWCFCNYCYDMNHLFKETCQKEEHIPLLLRCTGHHACSFFASDFEFGPNNCNPQGTDRYLEAHFVCHAQKDGYNKKCERKNILAQYFIGKNYSPSVDSRKLLPPWQKYDEEANSKRRIPVKPPEEREEDESQTKNSSGTSINSSRNGFVNQIMYTVNKR